MKVGYELLLRPLEAAAGYAPITAQKYRRLSAVLCKATAVT
ncbi:hypothetical protein [Lacticaseibacillus mingshuiensis]|uniref:Uncharacterized protein n=1 Tax=Lacticaseibacillus mingshuiensis TaxID=2799574 RepID=A0ABW4CIE4_9LACO|nr:hypothetical protein [Lacticaseibacillus mingshuiensis]